MQPPESSLLVHGSFGNCNFISFPCSSYKDYKIGSYVDCDDFKKISCPRLGKRDCCNYCNSLWKMNNNCVTIFSWKLSYLLVNMLTFYGKIICGITRENSSFPTKFFLGI